MLTKRQLIELLEKLDVPDNTVVTRKDYEYDHLELDHLSIKVNPAPIRVWEGNAYISKFGPHIVID